jgi:hypothetical protein
MLEQEIEFAAEGDLTRHEQVLSAIKYGESVDERIPQRAAANSSDLLAGQKLESNALADLISAWNRQRYSWLQERFVPAHPFSNRCIETKH